MTDAGPFRTWNGRESWEFVDGVRLHAIGGEQVLLCRVRYEPGKQVPWHAHEDTEQVMIILDSVGRVLNALAMVERYLWLVDHAAANADPAPTNATPERLVALRRQSLGDGMLDFLLGKVQTMTQGSPNTVFTNKWYYGLYADTGLRRIRQENHCDFPELERALAG